LSDCKIKENKVGFRVGRFSRKDEKKRKIRSSRKPVFLLKVYSGVFRRKGTIK